MDVDLKIMQELDVSEKNNKFENDAIKITRGAFELAKLYAKLSSKIACEGMECYGYLLMPKDSLDGVITNVHFADEQLVQSAYVRITDTAVYNASKMMEPAGYQIVGWFHSHGSMSTFHSGTDDDNFRTVLHSVAPRTMYRNKDLIYVVDENNNEVKFDNFVIKNVDAKKFKESKPTVLKHEEGQPYAYSMVVNMFGEYYLERISKTFNKKKDQYDVDDPIRPRLVVVDKDDDLEFLVSQVEKDIHKKLVFPYDNHSVEQNVCPDWESMNRIHNGNNNEGKSVKKDFSGQYYGLVQKFVDSTKKYLMSNPESKYGKIILSMLTSDENTYRYDILRDSLEGSLEDNQKNSMTEMLSDNKNIADNIVKTLSDMDARVYLDRSKRLNINEMRNLFVLQFMLDINKITNTEDTQNSKEKSENISETVDQMIIRYKDRCVNLADAFICAEKATKSLSYYAMERLTDYKNLKNHKYKNIISSILDKLNSNKKVYFNKAIYNEIKMPRVNNGNELFLYPDRLKIFNQLFQDIYEIKTGQENTGLQTKSALSLKKKDISYYEFLAGFADLYVNEKKGERTIDNFIEDKLLAQSGINKKNYFLFQDATKPLTDYTAEDKFKKRKQEERYSLKKKKFNNIYYGSKYLDDYEIEQKPKKDVVLEVIPKSKIEEDTKISNRISDEENLEKDIAEEINIKNKKEQEKKIQSKWGNWKKLLNISRLT